jgi:hypothetical protein
MLNIHTLINEMGRALEIMKPGDCLSNHRDIVLLKT